MKKQRKEQTEKECKHKRKFGRVVADNKIERVCLDCGKIIDYIPIKCSGVMV